MIWAVAFCSIVIATGFVMVDRSPTAGATGNGFLVIGIGVVALVIALLFGGVRAFARDNGQWQDSATRDWYQSLMQPDVPNASCCGPADAYFCDEIHVRQEKTFCAITDDRDDGPRFRPHRSLGTEFEIPNNKLKWDAGNPTGHAVIFLSRNDFVFCFVQGIGG